MRTVDMIYRLSSGAVVVIGNWLTDLEYNETVKLHGSDLTVDEKAVIIPDNIKFMQALRALVAETKSSHREE